MQKRKGGHGEKNEFPKENKGFVIKENVARRHQKLRQHTCTQKM